METPQDAGILPQPEKKHILIVDDNVEFLNILDAVLSNQGHRVTKATDGSRAYQLCMNNRYHAVVLDLKMPIMNGVESVKAIRRLQPDVPIYILSGEGEDHEIKAALEYGANGYLPKPFGVRTLVEILKDSDNPSAENS